MMNLDHLLYWVRERENIRLRKEVAGMPFPWTKDPILSAYRFCNVRREDDRVTRWIDEHIRKPYADNENLWFMLCAARAINWPDTLAVLISSGNLAWPVDDKFKPNVMGDVLEGLAVSGRKVFTGAYVITAPQKKGAKKTHFVAERTLGELWKDRQKFADKFFGEHLLGCTNVSIRSVHTYIMRYYDGWGPFMAYQAVVDMRFTRLLGSALDRNEWAAAGPGTIRGLNRLHGRAVDAKLPQEAALREMLKVYPEANARVKMDFSDVPNILCEFDKYMRVKSGEGAPRARYVPGRGS